jgi:hypothetical protein
LFFHNPIGDKLCASNVLPDEIKKKAMFFAKPKTVNDILTKENVNDVFFQVRLQGTLEHAHCTCFRIRVQTFHTLAHVHTSVLEHSLICLYN